MQKPTLTALHNFNIGDVVFYANMKPNKLDSQCHPKQVNIRTQGIDTFTLVNAATRTILPFATRPTGCISETKKLRVTVPPNFESLELESFNQSKGF